METSLKDKLMALGPEKLAQALIDLAEKEHSADELVNRLVATPQEMVSQV